MNNGDRRMVSDTNRRFMVGSRDLVGRQARRGLRRQLADTQKNETEI